MYYLNFVIQPVFEDEQGSSFSHPSSITLEIVDESGVNIMPVVKEKWDAKVILDWFCRNRLFILEESFPFIKSKDESIASAIRRFYDEVDPDDIDALDRMFVYRERHGLRLALRGLNVLDAYLGLGSNGAYEVSCAEDGGAWSFEVDLKKFFREAILKT